VPALAPQDTQGRNALIAAARTSRALSFAAVLAGLWDSISTFRPTADNTTAEGTLGVPFDIEAAARSLDGAPGVIVVKTDGLAVVGWFAVPSSKIDFARIAGGGWGRGQSKFLVTPGDPPELAWACESPTAPDCQP
jgi:hypothetical protein